MREGTDASDAVCGAVEAEYKIYTPAPGPTTGGAARRGASRDCRPECACSVRVRAAIPGHGEYAGALQWQYS